MILPKGSHVTKLIIKHYHECTKQQGKRMMLNEIWSRGYWIMGSSSAVSTVIASCVTCRNLRGPVIQQRMADLPEDRLESAPPFTYCAADYFGPFMVKEKRKEIKRYGVIFTCMASTAIHLEIANSLDTDSFWTHSDDSPADVDPFVNYEAIKELISWEPDENFWKP